MRSLQKGLVIAALISSTTLYAEQMQRPQQKQDNPPRKFNPRRKPTENIRKDFLKELNLTEEQKVKLKQLKEENIKKIKELYKKAMQKRAELNKMASSDKMDENAIRKVASESAAINAEITIMRAKMKKSFDAILTKEQKETLQKKRTQLKEKYKKKIEEMKKNRKEKTKQYKKNQDKKISDEKKSDTNKDNLPEFFK